jgi:hypothetical protein
MSEQRHTGHRPLVQRKYPCPPEDKDNYAELEQAILGRQ